MAFNFPRVRKRFLREVELCVRPIERCSELYNTS